MLVYIYIYIYTNTMLFRQLSFLSRRGLATGAAVVFCKALPVIRSTLDSLSDYPGFCPDP